VLLLEDNFVDAIARGEGPVHPQAFEIVVREGQGDGLSLIDLPAASLSCDDMGACGGTVSINGTGSADGDGTTITTGSDVTLRWRFGSYVTADIAAGDDPALIGNWTIQSGWGSTVFENIILDNIASGTAINFELQPDALSQKTGDASITVGLTVIDDGNTSDETPARLSLSRSIPSLRPPQRKTAHTKKICSFGARARQFAYGIAGTTIRRRFLSRLRGMPTRKHTRAGHRKRLRSIHRRSCDRWR
jgi:hypothetical protein